MSSINKAIILGNLGQDPEVRDANGTKCVTLSIATSEKWTDRNTGDKKERTEWHRVVVWGNKDSDGLAGTAEKYLRKGSKVYVEGKIQTRKWTDQSGVEKYTTEIVLQGFGAQLVLLDSRQSGGGSASHSTGNDPAFQPGGMDDDIPF